ncbi:MFS transporter [Spongiactinospora sp. TRM90649]|uniref:MFS transporter n=1 Tax=Spongiactinospora sp. TRM90649 TaxID=3031114 RepID=UPI0023F6C142|nr:MFS transporter [Spongiactinospora sp. TRM90649]MDF5756985.1 MFS transporter [Spongiactinospora sp. TRM90649]
MRDRHQRAIAAVFAVHGAVGGSFATRVPWLQEHLAIDTRALGFALLCQPIGAFVAMPLAGRLAYRFGGRATTRALLAMWTALLALPMLAPGPIWLGMVFLLCGASAGMSDVAMNAQGVTIERRLGRSIMSGLHGMWSVGNLAGAGIGAVAAHFGVDARLHLSVMAAALVATGLRVSRPLPEARPAPGEQAPPRFAVPPRAVLAVGLIGFCATFAEWGASGWAALYLKDVTGASPGVAAAGYAVFALFMVTTRLSGDGLVRKVGPVAAVRASGATAVLGGLLIVTGRVPAVVIAGFALMGLGLAVIVPLVFAAAGRAGPTPAQGVAGVATITYLSGLIAPPVTGWLAGAVAFPFAFALVTALMAAMACAAGVLRPRHQGGGRSSGTTMKDDRAVARINASPVQDSET